MPEDGLRLFIAVPLPAEARDACRTLIDAVRAGPAGRGPRWVQTENLHVTLRFLGATPADRLAAVVEAMGAAVDGASAFDVALAGAGSFPDGRRPRTLWIGIEQGAPELAALAQTLDDPLAALDWPVDARPFRPHLTVARTDAASGAASRASAEALVTEASGWRVEFRAERVALFRSHVGDGPPRYEPLAEVALRR